LLYSAGVAALNPFGVKSYLAQGQCMNENVCSWTFTDSWSFVVFRGSPVRRLEFVDDARTLQFSDPMDTLSRLTFSVSILKQAEGNSFFSVIRVCNTCMLLTLRAHRNYLNTICMGVIGGTASGSSTVLLTIAKPATMGDTI
jgi:hypothetical protein